jgi:hypothetical protein
MTKFFTLCAIVLSSFISAQSYSGPESVEFDYANNRWLIANKNNGTVIARDMNGNFSAFVSGMSSGPYGIEILGNTLYCCHNGGSIRGFDLTSGAQVFNLNLGATFLNGICSDGVNNLFVTDFSAKKIYRVNVLTSAFNVFVTGLSKSPNGIIYEAANSRLVFVNWGTNAPIMKVNLGDSTVSTLVTTTFSNIDGIAADAYGNYFISTWGTNSIRMYSNNFTTGPASVLTGLTSPADLFYNTVTDTLAIPNSGTANNVVWLGFTPLAVKSAGPVEAKTELFPQPSANGEFTIRNATEKIKSLRIFDLTGKQVFSKNVSAMGAEGSAIKVATSLPGGIYFAELNFGDRRETLKVVIE